MQPRVLVEVLDHLWKNRCTSPGSILYPQIQVCQVISISFSIAKQTHQGFVEDGDRHGAEVGWTLPWVKQAAEKVDFVKGPIRYTNI